MAAGPKQLLLASIHDVSPRSESQVDRLTAQLETFVGTRFAMLVVPNHWRSGRIRAGSPFASRLRAWSDRGVEMLLHGFYHRDEQEHRGLDRFRARFLTAREGEFLGLSRVEALKRIADGRALVEDIVGQPVTGFVAPAWLYGPGAYEALAESGVAIAEDHLRVWSPATGKVLARGPVITWASRSPMRLRSSLAAAALLGRIVPQRVLRIGVHPADCRSPALLASIGSTLRRGARSRTPAHYSELLSDQRPV